MPPLGSFQSAVNTQQAYAVEGDFASSNPYFSVLNYGAAFKSGLRVVIGRAVWRDPADANTVNGFGSGPILGLIHRNQQNVFQTYLEGASLFVYKGSPLAVFNGGDFWARNAGAAAVTRGMKAYASYADGSLTFAATGSPPTVASVTAQQLANSVTADVSNPAFTGSISGTTLTVSAISTGGLAPGKIISGGNSAAGVVVPNSTIVKQLTGTAGQAGTYQLNISQTVAGSSMTASGGWLHVTAVTSGAIWPGITVSGTGIVAGTKVDGFGTGAGGTGDYSLDTATTPGTGATVTGGGGFLNVTVVASGALSAGDVISGGSIVAGTYITQQISGAAGGVGHYLTSDGTASGSGTVTVAGGVETKWYAASTGNAGDLIQITDHPAG